MSNQGRILTMNDYLSLKKIINGSTDNEAMAIAIMDSCNIEKSFIYILCMMSQKINSLYVASSSISQSSCILIYIQQLAPDIPLPKEYTLDYIMKILKAYEHKTGKKTCNDDMKFILSEYKSINMEKSEMFTFKPVLKPKYKNKL